MKEDLMSVFHDFHAKDRIIKILNTTFIALFSRRQYTDHNSMEEYLSSVVSRERNDRHFEDWELRMEELKNLFLQ